ncbi:recombinase family protein [Lentzea sp. BCCO 10_0856]|uniref:Recombinase family protein n=1 Tax=Lentzea miocenica TaxID=3095431 RepID=A0ABU4SSE1_9PSEU|nr:recombinase family protein [Lentzea sp. BCCO 10_0856]MDX8028811.1 recombinase family protein [Lentzea sp. BCCO 10_0856]
MPLTLLRNEIRVAWLGRTSTDDHQDPRQSAMRQLGNSRAALPESWVIVAHFYDVESGRLELDERGQGTDYAKYDLPIPRDGGVADLLAESSHPGRRFDVVICESVARVARRTFEGLSIERELENAGVPLFASNEPITLSGSRAQRILQRRINQSVAEYEVLNILEQSWGGMCTHVREGWNIGKPPYGYKAKTYRHPNPSKAERGQTKTRLEPDGAHAETVTQIALWRYHEGIGYGAIADRLNADPLKYPPPVAADGKRTRGAWGKMSVYEILRNPKYTGYQVFNRRASRSRNGKVNDPALWVWSPEPAHEPLIPKWMYDELSANRRKRRGSREGNALNVHPETLRTYLYRALLFCQCGRRMNGTVRHDATYYTCWPKNNNRGRPDKYSGHRKAEYIRQDDVMSAVSQFLAERIFGPERRAMLAADLSTVDEWEARQRDAERDRLRRVLADVARRQNTIMRQAQDGDPDDPFTRALRATYNDLEAERQAALSAVATLDAADDTAPTRPDAADVDLLDALPYLTGNLSDAPEPLLRKLFEAVSLTVRITDDGDHVTINVRLPADTMPEIISIAETINSTAVARKTADHSVSSACADAVNAPSRDRSCTTHSGRC